MPSILQRICEYKKDEVKRLSLGVNVRSLELRAKEAPSPRGFRNALVNASTNGYGLITEIKRASPSKGLIRTIFEPQELARSYAEGGATCLSVLTDRPSFLGDPQYLVHASKSVSLPVLRKDFIIDPLQVIESRAMRADCILLIMAILDDSRAIEIEATAHEMGMDVLIEVHDKQELDRTAKLKSVLLGINNRNLNNFEVSLSTTVSLLEDVPSSHLVVSESGISTPADLKYLADYGVRCFLVGESLMRKENVTLATKALLAKPVNRLPVT